jgi:hypothetical protein
MAKLKLKVIWEDDGQLRVVWDYEREGEDEDEDEKEDEEEDEDEEEEEDEDEDEPASVRTIENDLPYCFLVPFNSDYSGTQERDSAHKLVQI